VISFTIFVLSLCATALGDTLRTEKCRSPVAGATGIRSRGLCGTSRLSRLAPPREVSGPASQTAVRRARRRGAAAAGRSACDASQRIGAGVAGRVRDEDREVANRDLFAGPRFTGSAPSYASAARRFPRPHRRRRELARREPSPHSTPRRRPRRVLRGTSGSSRGSRGSSRGRIVAGPVEVHGQEIDPSKPYSCR